MDIETYKRLALQTESTPRMTVTYGDGTVVELNSRQVHGLLGGASEIGEGLDPLKKFIIYREPMKRTNMIEEAGDKLWYLVLELDAIGSSLEEAMRANIAKLEKRFGGKFSYAAAHMENRDLAAEVQALDHNISPPVTTILDAPQMSRAPQSLMSWYGINRQAGHTRLMLLGVVNWLRDPGQGESPVAVMCVDRMHAKTLQRQLEAMLAASNQESLVNERVVFVTIDEVDGHRMTGRSVMPMAVDNHTVSSLARRWKDDVDKISNSWRRVASKVTNLERTVRMAQERALSVESKLAGAARALLEPYNRGACAVSRATVELTVADARSHLDAHPAYDGAGVPASAATIAYLADRVAYLEAQRIKVAQSIAMALPPDEEPISFDEFAGTTGEITLDGPGKELAALPEGPGAAYLYGLNPNRVDEAERDQHAEFLQAEHDRESGEVDRLPNTSRQAEAARDPEVDKAMAEMHGGSADD